MLSMNSLRAQQEQQQPPLPQHPALPQSQTQQQQIQVQYDPRSGPIMSAKELEAAVMEQGSPSELRLANPPPQTAQSL